MGVYQVRIEEHLERQLEVSADSFQSALAKATDMYRSCAVVLDAGDFTHATIAVGDSDKFDL